MILALAGHRPNKLGGYNLPNPTYTFVCKSIENILIEQSPDKIISGFALGADQWFASIGIKLGIPVIAAVPFVGQESVWTDKQKKIYGNLLSKCENVVIVSAGGYSVEKLNIRNHYLVDNCDKLIAVFDGSNSGTKNAVDYANSKNKEIIFVNPKEAT